MKIAVVGGGSTYTPELVDGLIRRYETMPVTEIALVDIDPDRLAVVGPLARRMCERAGVATRVTWTLDLVTAVANSTFVVSQIRVGGQAARERDEQLGREFGLIGQETVGVGGFAKALRTIPVALDIAEAIARHAPDAILLNFTNPAGLITEALLAHTEISTIGLCNVPWNFQAEIAKGLGVTAGDVVLDSVGLNHLTWIREVRVAGEDHTPAILDAMVARARRQIAAGREPEWDPDDLARIGALPNPYLRYYLSPNAMLAKQATSPTRASQVAAIEAALYDRYRDLELDEKPAELAQRGGAYYSEAAAALMNDIRTNASSRHVVNVRNHGAIPGLADDAVVEVAARVDAAGAHPIPTGRLRHDVFALVQRMKEFEQLTIAAAIHGDHQAAVAALSVNPLGPDALAAPTVWEHLRSVHRGSLGALDD